MTLLSFRSGNTPSRSSIPAFKTLTFVDVEQVIGRTRTLDATLQVSGGEERVEVSASSALMDRNTSAVTGLIERKQADELPLNGRNWASLTAFVPGAIDTGGSNQRSIRFAGRGLDDSNFTYDGVDATNIVNQTQRAWVRLAIPLDAIAGVPRRYATGNRRGRRDRRRCNWPSPRLRVQTASTGASSSSCATTFLTRPSPRGPPTAKRSSRFV